MKSLAALIVLATVVTQGQATPTLKDAYQGLFRIGAALNTPQFEDRDPLADPIIESQFEPDQSGERLKVAVRFTQIPTLTTSMRRIATWLLARSTRCLSSDIAWCGTVRCLAGSLGC